MRAVTTIEVVQEFAHVRARRRPRAEAAARARQYAVGFSPLLQVEPDDLFAGLDIFESPGGLGPFDAVLAGAALRRGWPLASADRSFGQLAGLAHLDPASRTFLDDVRAAI